MKKDVYENWPKKPDPTRNARQARRFTQLQAAAQRDGFESLSAALTAWKNGQARLVKARNTQRPKPQKRGDRDEGIQRRAIRTRVAE